MTAIHEPEECLRNLFKIAVETADPMNFIPKFLPKKPSGKTVVIGAGKASARMAEAVEMIWGPCEGIVITRYGYGRPTKGIEIIEAGHPVPDQFGVAATNRIMELVSRLGEHDHVLALISGGGSALLCAPAGNITLEEKQLINTSLLKSGASIAEMNIVRKHLSYVKGGQLAKTIYPANCTTLMISDVAGDTMADIASGPTVGENSAPRDAVRILEKYRIGVPESALKVLAAESTVIKPNAQELVSLSNIVVAAPSQSLDAAARHAKLLGIDVKLLGDDLEGEARELATKQVKQAVKIQRSLKTNDRPVSLLSGGECTVSHWGGGIGGPNAEFVLAAAIALEGRKGIHVLAGDTDGVDGVAEIAGAIATPETLEIAATQAIDPQGFLDQSASHSFFAAVGGQLVTGPTLTNVNDFRAILIQPEQAND